MIEVVWLTYEEEEPRGMWDQGLLELIFAGELWPTAPKQTYTHHTNIMDTVGTGAIVVFKGGANAGQIEKLNDDLSRLDWCLLIITGDEESRVNHHAIVHPNMIMWIAIPRPNKHFRVRPGTRFFGCGFRKGFPAELAHFEYEREYDYAFSGQVTHERRQDCIYLLESMLELNGRIVETEGFTCGLSPQEYAKLLANTKVAPCPSGPQTPDTFRLYEALEAGCIPIADNKTPGNKVPGKYWRFLFGGDPPFPCVSKWDDEAARHIRVSLEHYTERSSQVWAWWQRYKRDMAYWIFEDVKKLGGPEPEPGSEITVLISSSPAPMHPSTELLDETIASIRADLPDAEIIVQLDGIRSEYEHKREDYIEYIHRVVQKCAREWKGVLPVIFDRHTHQVGMMMATLPLVTTPYLLYVEHDTPIGGGYIDWHGFKQVLHSGEADMIRLYAATDLEPEHSHMLFDAQEVCGVPLTRTSQYSSRPHLATKAFYEQMMATHFQADEIAFVELRMHGVCASAYQDHGILGWYRHRIWIYTPEGNIQRSFHTNGRGDWPVYIDA